MNTSTTPWQHVQHGGDAADIRRLYEDYNVRGFLSAREEDERESGSRLRDKLLKDAVLLNEVLSPRIYAIVHRVQELVQLKGEFDVFCLRDQDINAFAHLDLSSEHPHHVIGITSGALDGLEDAEIAFLLGHEFGHFVFGHTRLLGLVNQEQDNPSLTVLPYLGECLFLSWRKKSETGADRNFRGPLVGAATLILLPDVLRFLSLPDAKAASPRLLIYGLLLVLMMHFRPQGVAGEYRME